MSNANRIYQIGQAGDAPKHEDFFNFPSITLGEIRRTIHDSFGDSFADLHNSIAVGAVLNDKNEIRGELIMVGDGDAYCAKPDGTRQMLGNEARIGFFQLAHFKPQARAYSLTVNTVEELKKELLKQLPEQGTFAVEVTGNFPEITFRSLSTEGQRIPECCLNSICEAHQKKFEGKRVSAKLVGFYSANEAVAPGVAFDGLLHLHGEGKDKQGKQLAGHVLDFKGPTKVTVQVMPDIGQWLQLTRDHIDTLSTPKWINQIRSPKHLAQWILQMPVYSESFEDHLKNHYYNDADKRERVNMLLQLKEITRTNATKDRSGVLDTITALGIYIQRENSIVADLRTELIEQKQFGQDNMAEKTETKIRTHAAISQELDEIQAALIDLNKCLHTAPKRKAR